jgi:hypothetical protein
MSSSRSPMSPPPEPQGSSQRQGARYRAQAAREGHFPVTRCPASCALQRDWRQELRRRLLALAEETGALSGPLAPAWPVAGAGLPAERAAEEVACLLIGQLAAAAGRFERVQLLGAGQRVSWLGGHAPILTLAADGHEVTRRVRRGGPPKRPSVPGSKAPTASAGSLPSCRLPGRPGERLRASLWPRGQRWAVRR